MMALETKSNIHQTGERPFKAYKPGDDFYEALIAMHEGLTDEQSHKVNAKLILLLANHVGDIDVLREAMAAARKGIGAAE